MDRKGQSVQQGESDRLDRKASSERRALLVNREQPVSRVQQVPKEQLGRLARRVRQATPGSMDRPDRRGRLAKPAPKDLDPAELAAWTSVARTVLNLHAVVTRN